MSDDGASPTHSAREQLWQEVFDGKNVALDVRGAQAEDAALFFKRTGSEQETQSDTAVEI